jgi:MFS family permease
VKVIGRIKAEFAFIQGNFLILILSWILMDLVSEMPLTYYGLYVKELHGDEFIIGVIGFAASMALASVQFPGGYLADKYGRKWLVSSMTFGVALSYLFYALAQSWEWILIGAVMANLCLIYQPALFAMVMDSLPSEKRGLGFSIINLIVSVSTTPAPLIAGLLYLNYGLVDGMRICYLLVVSFYLAAAILRLRLHETIQTSEKIDFKGLLRSYPESLKESVKVWKKVPSSTFYLFLSNLLFMFSLSIGQPFFVIYATEVLLIEKFYWSIILTTLFITMIVISLPIGKLIDKVGRKKPLIAAHLLIIPAILLFVYGDLTRLFIAFPLIGGVQLMFFSSAAALRADLVPKEQRGKVQGFTSFFNYVFMALGNLLGGFLYRNVSQQLPFLLPIILVPMEILIILFLVKEPSQKEL